MIDATDQKIFLNLSIIGPLVVSSGAAPAAVAAAASAEQSFGVGAWKVGDLVLKIQKPTKQAGLAVTGARVDGAGLLQVEFTNPTAGVLTPTALEAYKIVVAR